MSVLAQIINVTIKLNDGTRINEADSSSSQCMPVNPKGHRHSYFWGGGWSRHRPPLRHGWKRHSFSFVQPRSDRFKPAGQLLWTSSMCAEGDDETCAINMKLDFFWRANNNHVYTNRKMWKKERKQNIKLELSTTYLPSTECKLLESWDIIT